MAFPQYDRPVFGTHEDIPPRGDWDRHFEILDLGRLQMKVQGQAACGCMWTLNFVCEEGQPTFRQVFDIFGAKFTFNSHTEEHALICEETLPPNITEEVKVRFSTTVADILAEQP